MPRFRTSALLALATVAATMVVTSCRDELGPEPPRVLSLALAPNFDSQFAGLVPVTTVRLTAVRKDFGVVVADTVINVAGQDSVDIGFRVPVAGPSEIFLISMALVGTASDTVFRGGPIEVLATDPVVTSSAPLTVNLTYVGPGAAADSVVVTTVPPTLFTGGSTLLQAVAYDNDTIVPGTPVAWIALDSGLVSVPDYATGQVVAGSQRGTGRVVAELLSGPRDTASILVQPAPASGMVAAGAAQSGEVALALGAPVTIRVLGGDSLGVQNAIVRFAGDGTFSPDTGVTDVNGDVTTTWTLGPVAGTQTALATVDDQPAPFVAGPAGAEEAQGAAQTHVSIPLTATGMAGPATQVAFTSQPTSQVAGDPIPTDVSLLDSLNNVVQADSSTSITVSILPSSGTAGASILGTNPRTVLTGVAAFTDLAIDSVGTGYRLEAVATGLQPDTSATFDIGVGTLSTVGLTPAADTVTALGDSTLFTPTATDSLGNAIAGTMFAWSSSDSSVAVPNAQGYAVAIGNGSATIIASSGSITGTATLVVQQTTSSVNVTPASVTLTAIPDTTQYSATALDANANPIPGALFVWSLSDSSVASVDATGQVISLANGTTGVIATSGGVADTAALTVGQVATVLAFTPQPVTTVAGDTIAVSVEARDAASAIVPTFTDTVTVAWAVNPSGAALNGTASVVAVGGVATFTDLYVTAADTGYTLEATSGTLPPDTSAAFDITPNVGTDLVFTVQPTDAFQLDTIAPPVEVTAFDTFGNLANGFTDTVTVQFAFNPGVGVLSGTTQNAAVAGVATFADLSVDITGGGYTLLASSPGLTPDTSTAFNINSNLGGGVHWTNTAGGNWSDATSWNTGLVPTALDTVYIDASGTYTVALNQNATVTQLQVGGATGTQTLAISGNTLQVDSGGTVLAGDSVHQTGGTFRGVGRMDVFGSWTWNGGVWTDTGVVQIASGATLTLGSAAQKTMVNRRTEVAAGGTVNVTGTGTWQFQQAATLQLLQPGALVDLQTDAALSVFNLSSGSIQNGGTIQKSGGTGTAVFGLPFVNLAASLLDVQTGNVQLNAGGTLDNTVTIAGGSDLLLTGGTYTLVDGFTTAGGTAGTVTIGGGTATVGSAATDTVRLGHTLQNSGSAQLNGPGVLLVTDTYDWQAGSWNTVGGVTHVPSGATLTLSTANQKTVTNRLTEIGAGGTATVTGTGLWQFQQAATLDVLPTGLVDLQTDAPLGVFNLSTGSVQNGGTFQKSGGTGTTAFSLPFVNLAASLLDIQTGNVQLNAGGTLDNTVTIAGGSDLLLAGGTYTLVDGFTTVGGTAGTVTIGSGGVATVGAAATDTVRLGHTIQNSGSAQLNGPGVLLVTDTYDWLSGSWNTVGGVTHVPSGATLTLSTANQKTVTNRLTEVGAGGTVTVTGTGLWQFQQAATLDVLPAGLVDLQSDAALGVFNLSSGTIQNAGTVQKSSGAGNTLVSLPFTNMPGALLDVQTGGFQLNAGATLRNTITIAGGSNLTLTSGTFTLLDSLTIAGGTAGTVTIGAGGQALVGLASTDTVRLGHTIQNSGSAQLSGPGVLLVTDTYDWQAGSWNTVGGVTHVPSGATLTLSTASQKTVIDRRTEVAASGTINVTGTGTWQFQQTAFLDVLAGGLVDLQTDASLGVFSLSSGAIRNAGTIQKSVGTGNTLVSLPFTNMPGALLDVQTGGFQLNAGGTLRNTITIAGGSNLTLTSGTYTLVDSLTIAGGTAGTLTLGASTQTLVGLANTDTVRLGHTIQNSASAQVVGPGVLLITDTYDWQAGLWSDVGGGGGVTHIPSGGTLTLSTGSQKTLVDRLVEVGGSGTIAVTGGGTWQFQQAATLDVQAGALVDLQSDAAFGVFSLSTGTIQNAGRFQKSAGTGTSAISIPFTNNDTLDVQTGTIQITSGVSFNHTSPAVLMGNGTLNLTGATVTFNGAVAPGASAGILGLTGTFTPGGSHTFEAEIEGNIPGIGTGGHDQFNVSGAVTLNGTLDVTFPGAYLPAPGDAYEIITSATSMTGSFTTVNFPSIGATFDTATVGNSFYVNVLGANFNRWQNASGGSWSTGSNWSLGTPPNGATDTAIIDLVGNYTVTLDVPVTVDALILGAGTGTNTQTLEVVGNDLTVNTSANLFTDGTIQHRAGAVTGAGAVTVAGTGVYRWTGGTISGNGTTALTSTSQLLIDSTAAKTLDTRTLDIQGAATWLGGGPLTMANGATLINGPAAPFDAQATALIQAGTGTGTFQNNGPLAVTNNLTINVPFNNADSVDVAAGTLNLGGGGVSLVANTPVMHVATGAAISYGGGTFTSADSIFGAGNVFIASGAAGVTIQGGYNLQGTTNVNGPVSFSHPTDTSRTGGLNIQGGTLGGTGVLQITGNGSWNNTATLAGNLHIPAGVTFNINNTAGRVLNGALIENDGTINWATGGSMILSASNGATILNQPGAVIDLQADGIIDSTVGVTSSVVNQGTILKTGGTTFTINVQLTNTDSIDVSTGTLSLTKDGINTGAIRPGTGAAVSWGGGTHALGGRVVGPGQAAFFGATATVTGTYATGQTTIGLNSAVSFANGGLSTTDLLSLAGGTLTGPDTILVNTSMSWSSGDQTGPGTTRIGSGASLNFTATTAGLDQRQVVNEGTFTWSGTGTLTADNGAVITNAAGAAFNPQDGATLAQGPGTPAAFVNNGLVSRTGFNNFVINTTFDNNDSVDVQGTGGFEVLGGGTSPGFYNVASTGTLIFAGGHSLDTVLAPGGFVEFGAGANQITGALNAGTLRLTGGTAALSTTDTSRVGTLQHSAGDLTGTAVVAISNATGGFWSGGNWLRLASVYIRPGVAISFSAVGASLDSTTVVNDGTIDWTGGDVTGLNGAVIFNRVGATVNSIGTTAFNQGVGGASLDNQGTVQHTNSSGTTHTFGADFNNAATGVVDAQTGNLAWTGNFDHLAGAMIRGQGGSTIDLGGATIGTYAGDINPGFLSTPGVLNYVGALAPGGASTVQIEIDGATPGTGGGFHDQLNVTGAVTLGGTLNVSFPGAFVPNPGDQFEVVTSTSGITGSFATVNLPTPGGVTLDTATIGNSFYVLAPSGMIAWVGGSGNWSNPANWTLGRAPVFTDTVFIDTTGSYTVTLDQNATVNRLVLGGASGTPTLETAGFSLQITNSANFNGNGTLAINGGGSVTGAGTFQIDGTVDWSDGDLLGLGSTAIVGTTGVLNVVTGGPKQYQRNITLNGTLNLISDDLTVGASSVLNPSATGLIDIQGDFSLPSGGAPVGTITSTGVVQKSGGTGISTVGAVFNNNNLLDVQTGTLQLSGGGTSGGAFNADGILQFSGGTHSLTSAATVTGNGMVTESAGNTTIAGAYNVDSTQVTGGFFSFSRAAPDSSVTNTLIIGGGSLSGNGLLHVTTSAQWIQGTTQGGGTTRIGPAATMALTGPNLKTIDNRTIDNEGVLQHTGGGGLTVLNGSSIVNRSNATISLQAASAWGAGGGAIGTLDNQGLLEYTAAGAFQVGMVVNNSDSIEVSGGGTLQFSQGGTSSGTSVTSITVGTLQLQAGTFAIGDSVIGSGTFLVSGGNATLSGPFSVAGFSLTGGTANLTRVADTMVVQSFQHIGGTLTGPATLRFTVGGSWTGGTHAGTGSTHVPAGAFFVLGAPVAARTLDTRTIDNEGTIQWTGSGQIDVSNGGTINNLAGGLFDAQTPGTLLQQVQPNGHFNNQGMLRRSTTGGTFQIDIPLTNTDTVDVQVGTLQFTRGDSLATTGTFLANGDTLFFGGGTFALQDSVTGPATVRFDNTNAQITGAYNVGTTFISSGTTEFSSSTVSLTDSLVLTGGALEGTGVLRLTGTGSRWVGGTMSSVLGAGGGSVNVAAGADLDITGGVAKFLNARTIDNDGTVTWTASNNVQASNGASINNNGNAVWDIQQAGAVGFTAGVAPAVVFTNTGLVHHTGGGGPYTFAIDFVNDLVGTDTGMVDVGTATIAWTGSYADVGGSILRGDGILDFSGATISAFDGTVNPGTSPGILGYTGNFTSGVPSVLNIELDGTTPGSGVGFHDQLNISGTFGGGGDLNVIQDVNYTPTAGDSLIIMTFTTRGAGGTSTFRTVTLPTVSGFTVDTVWTATDLAVVFRSAASGNINQWVGGTGSWNIPGNWSLGRVPLVTDTVDITQSGSYTVTLNVSDTVDAIILGGASGTQTLSINTDTLRVVNGGQVLANGQFDLLGGRLSGPGTITVDGLFRWLGGDLVDTGTLSISTAGNLILDGGVKNLDQHTIENAGTATWIAGQLRGSAFSGGATVRNLPSGTFELQGIGPYTFVSNPQPTFDNQGTLTRTMGAGTFAINALFTNTGNIDLQTGTLDMNGSGSWGGSILTAANTVFIFGAGAGFGHSLQPGLLVTGPGIARIVAGNTVSVNPGTVNIDHLEMTGGTLDGTGTLLVNDTLDWLGGTMTEAGVTRATSTFLIRGAGAKSLGNRTLENAGTADWSAGDIQGVGPTGGGSFYNLGGATMQVTGGVAMTQTGGTLPTFINSGTLDISGALTSVWNFDHVTGLLQGNGVLDITGATVTTMGGDVGPGTSPGVLTIVGPYPQAAGSNFIAEIEGPTPGVGAGSYDYLAVSGAATLNGAAAASFIGGYTPVVGDRYDVLTFGSTSGGFGGGINLPAPQGNLTFDSRFYPNSFVVGVTQTTTLGVGPQVMSRNTLTDSLYILAGNQLMPVDIVAGARGGLTSAGMAPQWVEVHEALDKIYVTEVGQGQINVLSGADRSGITTITGLGSTLGEIAAHQSSDSLYISYVSAVQGFPVLAVIDGAQDVVAGGVQIGTSGTPQGVAVDPVNNRVFAVLSTGWLVRIDSDTRTLVDSVAVGTSPIGVAVDPFSRLVYVVNSGSLDVTVIDDTQQAANAVVGTITGLANSTPWSIAVDAKQQVVVGYQDETFVTILDGLNLQYLYDLPNGSASTSFVEFDPNSGAFFFDNTADQTLRGSR